MPALVAGIRVLAALQDQKTWMAGTSPAMTPSVAAPAFLRFNCQTALANAPPPCFFAAPGAPSLSPPERGLLPFPSPSAREMARQVAQPLFFCAAFPLENAGASRRA